MKFTFGAHEIAVNMPDRAQLLAEVRRRFDAGEGFALATVNLDHLVKLRADAEFARVYAAQDLVVADGRPIVTLSRLAGQPVELVPGSDLVRPLCETAAAAGVPIAFVGSHETALADAARILTAEIPGLSVVYSHAPAMGFDPDGDAAGRILEDLQTSGARLCFLALGAPKQERFALRGRTQAPAIGFASVGAGVDFIGGHQKRAPLWMRQLGVEWLWRALGDPLRLGPRYAKCAAILPGQTVRALQLRSRPD
ncbi:WecB/TagA/CpsF family glycosyltransferase [Lutimaribacter marinistellae]|uniref:WecB/TagA/CpsF family glycosyltransferase n=1 Tax=Lutimaribacter marinistellae TaxID=1820329 RepID=A0ABV7THD6_9RHOB